MEEDKVRVARSSIMANDNVISSQILTSVLPFGILHADIPDLVVKVLGPRVSVASRSPHLEDAILDRQKREALKVPPPMSQINTLRSATGKHGWSKCGRCSNDGCSSTTSSLAAPD